MAAHISRSDSASESASSAVLDGAGVIGDSIGMTDYAIYNHGRYYSRSNTFYNRSNYYRGGGERGVAANVQRGVSGDRGGINGGRGGVYNRPGATARPFNGNTQAARGYAEPRGQSGVRSGAFSGYDHGGQTRSFSSRGSASFGGGGWRRGGGGGSRGGGGGRHR